MSGQPLEIIDQSLNSENIELVDELNVEETATITEVDSLAAFREKHGHKLIPNHEGQLVRVAEALDNCPPYARLVAALGEGALSLFASQKPEQVNEVEVEDIEDLAPEIEESKARVTSKDVIKAKESRSDKALNNKSKIQSKESVEAELNTKNSYSQQNTQSETPKPKDPELNKVKVIKSAAITDKISTPASVEIKHNQSLKADLKIETIAPAQNAQIENNSQEILLSIPKAAVEIVQEVASNLAQDKNEKIVESKPEDKKVHVPEIKPQQRSVRKEYVPIKLKPETIESKKEFIYDLPTIEIKPKTLDLGIKAAEVPSKLLETDEIDLKTKEISEEIILENEPLEVTKEQSIYGIQPLMAHEILAETDTAPNNPIKNYELKADNEKPSFISLIVENSLPTSEELNSKKVVEGIAEAMSTLEPETVFIVNELLDDTARTIQEIKQPDKTETDIEIHQAEVIEIFSKVFKKLSLELSNEDVGQLVNHLIKDDRIRQINGSNDAKLLNYALSDIGTHEGLTYLLSRTKSLKYFKGSTHNALGQLVLRAPKFQIGQRLAA